MKRTIGLTTLFSFLAVLAISEVKPISTVILPPAQASSDNQKCSLSSIKGSYAIQLTGWIGSGASRLPFASAGTFSADGNGYLQMVDTAVIDGGQAFQRNLTATYTVDANTCTGSVVSSIGGSFNFQIIDKGKKIIHVSTTPGTTISGTSTRQF
ncbi:MAG TPA: hypothetical protein V6D25_15990 [Leptolyngbyaceae cyanobacterium]